MRIALYGATGYTGRLTVDELHRRGLDFVLSGRSREKLERLAQERGGGAPVRAASIDDSAALTAVLEDCDVVISCAGPFTQIGEAVVRAAIDTGTHYVDSTGEQGFMRMVFDRYGEQAERAGVALIPAMGFDYVPGDCAARLAAEGLEPLEELMLAYDGTDFGATQGTMRSVLEVLRAAPIEYREGDWRPGSRGVHRASFDFPEPAGRQTVTRYASGEALTVPRHTRTRKVTSVISARTLAPSPPAAAALPYLQPALALGLRTPLRGLVDRGIDRLPEGPSEAARQRALATIVAVARGEDGREGMVTVRCSDPYGLTAATLVYAAERMGGESFGGKGALGPAAAFDAAATLDYLGGHGLTWERGSS